MTRALLRSAALFPALWMVLVLSEGGQNARACDHKCRESRWFAIFGTVCTEFDLNHCTLCVVATTGGCTEKTSPGLGTCINSGFALRKRGDTFCGHLCPVPNPPDDTQADFIQNDPMRAWVDTGTTKFFCLIPFDD